MLSVRQWLVLLGIYMIYLLVGSVVFMYIEIGNELADREDLQDLKKRVIDTVASLDNDSRSDVTEVVQEMSDNCKHDFLHLVEDEPLTWSLWNSFFFAFTVITTIGFGHMSPSTQWGKVFCIFYATVGVPLNGILIASLADIFTTKVVNSRVRARAKRYESWIAVATDATLYLLPGFLFFLVLPAAILVAAEEGWDYLDSFYYAFITLTTIGFGDYVGGLQEDNYFLMWLYKIISFIWIIFGLGYIIMSITFIQNALKSKRIHNIEKKLARGLKKHTNKMNINVQKDLKRLRTVVNTLSVIQAGDGSQGEGLTIENKRKQSFSQEVEQANDRKNSNSNDNRVFLSHHHTPSVTPRHEDLKMKRSASDIGLGMAEKNPNALSNSFGDINIFLDVVESLLKEHEAEAAKNAENEAHNIVQDAINSSDSADAASDEEPSKDQTASEPKDIESGFVNKGFIDDEDNVVYKINDTKTQNKSDKTDDHHESLKRKLSSFLGLPDFKNFPSKKSSDPATVTSKNKVGDLLGMMENYVQQPPHADKEKSLKLKCNRQLSMSVPGHYRKSPDSGRSDITEIFTIHSPDIDSNNSKIESPSSNQDTSNGSFSRRRWSFSEKNLDSRRFSHQSSDNGDDEVFNSIKNSKGTPLKILPKSTPSSETENKNDAEETSREHTRL